MRSVGEYLQKAAEFDELAAKAKVARLKKRFADVADCYRLLAEERNLAEHAIDPDRDDAAQ